MGPTGGTGDRRRMTADSGYLEMARASAGKCCCGFQLKNAFGVWVPGQSIVMFGLFTRKLHLQNFRIFLFFSEPASK